MKVILGQLKKPWNETRLKEKIGHSLEKIEGCSLYYFGQGGQIYQSGKKPEFIQIPENQPITLSLFEFFQFILKIKPDAVIIASPILLVPALVYKYWKGLVLVFDCPENYPGNFAYQSIYPKWKSTLFSILSHFFLSKLIPLVDKIWLAEKIYTDQLDFIPPGKWQIFENKVSELWIPTPFIQKRNNQGFLFLLTGFMTVESGLARAFAFMQAFKKKVEIFEFQLVGKIAEKKKKEDWVKNFPWADLNNCSNWTDSSIILNALRSSDAVLIPYVITKANEGKFPTKMYEAIFAGKPMLCQSGSGFLKLAEQFGLGIPVDFEKPENNDFGLILEQIKNCSPIPVNFTEIIFEGERLRKDFLGLFPKKELAK